MTAERTEAAGAPRIEIADFARVTFLTGAGISVASGIPPFRGPGGIWNEVDIRRWATAEAMDRDPAECWRAHRELARLAAAARPNEAHAAIARLEAERGSERVAVLTQNVDALHGRAGSRRVVELHGSLARVRCAAECGAPAEPAPPAEASLPEPPSCARCGRPLRHDIVLFEEALPVEAVQEARRALVACDLFIAVGTSGIVWPAAGFAEVARVAGARTVLVNLEPHPASDETFTDVILGKAEEVLPSILQGL
jgi:NAD-dependent SIR2 family protein deacetylase